MHSDFSTKCYGSIYEQNKWFIKSLSSRKVPKGSNFSLGSLLQPWVKKTSCNMWLIWESIWTHRAGYCHRPIYLVPWLQAKPQQPSCCHSGHVWCSRRHTGNLSAKDNEGNKECLFCFSHRLVTPNKNPRFHIPQGADSMEAKHPHEANLTLLS